MSAIPLFDPDAALEDRILTAATRCALAKTQDEGRQAWNELTALLRQRSPERVRKMEREKGLI